MYDGQYASCFNKHPNFYLDILVRALKFFSCLNALPCCDARFIETAFPERQRVNFLWLITLFLVALSCVKE
jgi:hypothetical protein